MYRLSILLLVIPTRRPSSTESESYFMVVATMSFQYILYIIAPILYFRITMNVPDSYKIKQLFTNVFIFISIQLIFSFIDFRYWLFSRKRHNLMKSWRGWGKFCQMRLHEELGWSTFPIELKLSTILNLWTLTTFFIFQIPYLIVYMLLAFLFLWLLDKRNIHRHYKMQSYRSNSLEISVQRVYIY
jgi:hypothetical protein